MTYLLPAPPIAGLLMARCPVAGEEPVYPEKAIIITTAQGSVKVNGYADIERELRTLMRQSVVLIEPREYARAG